MQKYSSKVKESCEKQLQAMLEQYNDKLGTYESNLKDQTLNMMELQQKADKQQLAYKELKSRMNEQLRDARAEARGQLDEQAAKHEEATEKLTREHTSRMSNKDQIIQAVKDEAEEARKRHREELASL